jgi:F420-non-reducing hydrogenase small subunit
MKPKILITSLTSCNGCLVALLELDIFPELLESVDIVYFPLIDKDDRKEIENCDIALIEGCITNDEQNDEVLEIRKKAKKIIALGTCAIFGGITSLSNEMDSIPIDQVIEIDGFIPGCPTPPELLGNSLMAILSGDRIKLSSKNLCLECELRPDNGLKSDIKIDKLHPVSVPFECFLHENVLCLGPITRSGCKAKCIKANIPCEGCMGPIVADIMSNMVNFFSTIEVSEDIKASEALYSKFTHSKSSVKTGVKR